MYEFGEGKTLLKTSEVRPEGFSYYNRVYNSHETGGESGQGKIYHEGEYERYEEAEDHEGEHLPRQANCQGNSGNVKKKVKETKIFFP